MLSLYQPQPFDTQLSTTSGGRLISRIFTDQNGRTFRLTFFVAVVNGELKGSLVSAQPLSKNENITGQGTVLCLPISCPKVVAETPFVSAYAPVVSPFSELFFFTSQPTRAPSGK
jgi:hypothetical protein